MLWVLSIEVGKQLDPSLAPQELRCLPLQLLVFDRTHVFEFVAIGLGLFHVHIQVDHWLVDYRPATRGLQASGRT